MKVLDDLVYSLVTREGFTETFWSELSTSRSADPSATQRQVFERLNNLFRDEFGRDQFPSFEAFRKYRDKR